MQQQIFAWEFMIIHPDTAANNKIQKFSFSPQNCSFPIIPFTEKPSAYH